MNTGLKLPGSNANEGGTPHSRALKQEPKHHILFSMIPRTPILAGGLTPLQGM